MPSESARLMQTAYGWLDEQCALLIYMNKEEEARLKAKLEINFGLTPNKADRMIENMVLTQKIERRQEKPKTDPRAIREKAEAKEVDKILKAKPK